MSFKNTLGANKQRLIAYKCTIKELNNTQIFILYRRKDTNDTNSKWQKCYSIRWN